MATPIASAPEIGQRIITEEGRQTESFNIYLTDLEQGINDLISVASPAFAQFSNAIAGTAVIPLDDTKPQITEGFEVMTLDFTPNFADSNIIIDVNCLAFHTTTGTFSVWSMAVFRESISDTLSAVYTQEQNDVSFPQNHANVLTTRASDPAGSIDKRTYKVRIGPTAGNLLFNGAGTTRVFGDTPKSSIYIREIRA